MAIDVQTIEPLDFFRGLTYEELKEFAALLNPISIQAGEIIIHKGTKALTFYVILSGRFEASSDTGRSFTIDKKGEIMGWSTITAPFYYRGTVSALEDGELLYLSGRHFFQLIQNNNKLGEKIMRKIGKIANERRAIYAES